MKKTTTSKSSRRSFLRWGFLSGLAAALGSIAAKRTTGVKEEAKEAGAQLLTADGKLVTVSNRALEKASLKQKASDREIHNFVHPKRTMS